MGFQKKQDTISDEKLAQFLNGGKDDVNQVDTDTTGDGVTQHTNVNNVSGSVTNLIGKAATFEQNFTRQTYYIHNDLIKALNKITRRARRGEKTKIINAALEQYLNSMHKE